MPKEKFEDALEKLEKIVSKLEDGDIPLEESLKLFEEGIRLTRFCNQKLDEAEKRVEILLKGKDGTIKAHPFDPLQNSMEGSIVKSDRTLFNHKEKEEEEKGEEEEYPEEEEGEGKEDEEDSSYGDDSGW